MFTLDTSTPFGTLVAKRLATDHIIWLTTVRAGGPPVPSPVWFLWDGEAILVYNLKNALRLRDIAERPKVSLNFNATPTGSDVVILTGQAAILPDHPPANAVPAYVTKYTEGFRRIGMDAETFGQRYPIAVRITPTHLFNTPNVINQ